MMKDFVSRQGFFCFAVILAASSLGYNVSQNSQIQKFDLLNKISRERDLLLSNGYEDVTIGYLKGIQEQNLELVRNQGRIEGILSVIQNYKPEENLASGIWHAGYYRGLEQTADMSKSLAAASNSDKKSD